MKKLILFFFAITAINFAQTWERVLENTFAPLVDVYFYSEDRGWISGNSGTFAQTTDGGQTWIDFEMPDPNKSLYSIFFYSKMEGFVGAYDDIIYKTVDGGVTWEEIHTGSSIDGPSGKEIYFADDHLTGWCLMASYSAGEVLKTTDGGSTWHSQLLVSTGDIESMSFSSPGHGICVGGGSGRMDLYYTKDGETWTKGTNPSIPPIGYSRLDVRGVSMANDNVAYAVGWGTRSLGLQPSLLLKTTDGGETWTYLQQEPENRQYVNLYAVIALDENTAIAGGGAVYEGTVIIKTTDGGANWYRMNAPFGFSIKSFNQIGNRIWAVGSGGVTIYSDDGGENWQSANQIPSTSPWASFYDGENFIATGGYGGLLIFSTDRGNSWQSVYAFDNGVCPSIQGIQFLNTNLGFLARNNKVVNKTTDGGLTWTTIMKDTTDSSVNNYAVQFFDESFGYVVGKSGSGISAFYKTTDGGNTWEAQIGNLNDEINDLYFKDTDNGVIVGDEMLIAYTTDGGSNWEYATINGVVDAGDDINGVVFYDDNNGLAYGDELFKTTDGGRTWDYVSYAPYDVELKGASILDDDVNHWIVVGMTRVLETFDGGASWSDIADLSVITATQLYTGLADKSGYYWTTGGTSEIYKTVNPVDVESEIDEPLTFSLSQNYPNPFNPSTVIKFSIPTEGKVKLKIYDSLGREVAVLLNKTMSPGSYKVDFNASQLSSGVYFYRLEETSDFSNFNVTKKMILIK